MIAASRVDTIYRLGRLKRELAEAYAELTGDPVENVRVSVNIA